MKFLPISAVPKIGYCGGYCLSTTVYKEEYPHFKSNCNYCRARKKTVKFLTIACVYNNKMIIEERAIDSVEECHCTKFS